MNDLLEPPREEPRWTTEADQPDAGRIPPHDLTAETALLGAAMLDINAATIAAGTPPDAWYAPAHGVIADAIASLVDANNPIDTVTVWDQIKRDGMVELIGGVDVLLRIMESCPATSVTAAKRYRSIIVEHHRSRSLIAAAAEVADAAYRGDPDTALGYAEKALDSLAANDRGTVPISDAVLRHIEVVEARQSGTIPTVKSGLVDLDRLLGGFRPGGFYVLAGRPAMGKSAVACQLALNIARAGRRVLFATLEMSETELMDRFAASVGRINHTDIRDGKMDAAQWAAYHKAAGQIATWPIDVLDQAEASIPEVRADARSTKTGLIIVDYLTLVKATGKHGNRQEEVANIARGCKTMARALDVPVVALAQLHRGVEARAEKRPLLSDLRESGEIEQAADAVLMLYRDEYYDQQSADAGLIEIALAKHRHGPQGVVMAAFLAEVQAVANAAPDRNRRVA